MTPPKKKSASKSGARTKKGAAKTARSAAKGSGRSGAGSGSKASAASRPKAKKRAAPSKKGRHPAEYIALAFFLGLVLASAIFLLMRPEPDQTAGPGLEKGTAAKAAKKTGTQSPLPKIPPQKVKEAARKTESGPRKAESAKKAAPPRPLDAKPAPPAAGTLTPPAPPAKADTGERLAERNKAVASALIDLKSLPYEESMGAALDERIRQVDYALIQAAWLRKLPASAMRLTRVEDRLEGTEPYHYQVIDVLPGKTSKAYQAALQECLAAWAEGATLEKSGHEQWAVSLNGVRTHLIRLFPGRSDFPPSPEVTAKADPLPETRSKVGKTRVRKPGEAAKLVIVIDDLGASATALHTLMNLNYPVTFAFWPHGAHTRRGAKEAHAAGREILVHQPMEPMGYPKVRPGPNVLLVGMDQSQIRRTLQTTLSAVPHAVGLNNHMGSRFTQHAPGVDAVLAVLRERDLFMLDSLTHNRSVFADRARQLNIEHYRRNVFLDVIPTRENVLAQLRHAERIALLTGQAVAIGHPLPETLSALKEWQRLRNREVRIVRLRDLEQE